MIFFLVKSTHNTTRHTAVLFCLTNFLLEKKGVTRLAWVLTTDKSVKNSSLVRLSRRRFMPCFAAGTN